MAYFAYDFGLRVSPVLEVLDVPLKRPVVADRDAFMESGVEFGYKGQQVNSIIVDIITLTPGMGPRSQVVSMYQGLTEMGLPTNIDIHCIETETNTNGYHAELPEPDVKVDMNGEIGIPGMQMRVEEAYYNLFRNILDQKKIKEGAQEKYIFGIAGVGYEGITEVAVTNSLGYLEAEGYNVGAVTVEFDSTYNAGFDPSLETDDEGFPLDACHPQNYKGHDTNRVWQVSANTFAPDATLIAHAAGESDYIAGGTHPFPESKIAELRQIADIDKSQARREMVAIYRELDDKELCGLFEDTDRKVVTIAANNEYYSGEQGMGRKFLTDEQVDQVLEGSRRIIQSLALAFGDRKGLVFVPEPMLGLVDEFKAYNPYFLQNVVFKVAPRIKPDQMKWRYASSDLYISRTTQMNGTKEAAIAGLPVLVMNMPGNNFMYADIHDANTSIVPTYESQTEVFDPIPMAQDIWDRLFDDRDNIKTIVDGQVNNVIRANADPAANIFSIIRHAFGIEAITPERIAEYERQYVA
ncbi:MAG TPA: glycosyltransferase [Candidatus Dojkabacteria bacterium]|jgi:hypothetical protein